MFVTFNHLVIFYLVEGVGEMNRKGVVFTRVIRRPMLQVFVYMFLDLTAPSEFYSSRLRSIL